MHRPGALLGIGHSQYSSSALLALFVGAIKRPTYQSFSFAFTPFSPSISRSQPAAHFASSRTKHDHRHFAGENTSIPRPGPPASVAAHLGIRRTLHFRAISPAQIHQCTFGGTPPIWSGQKRWLSDRPSINEPNISEGKSNLNQDIDRAEAGSKNTATTTTAATASKTILDRLPNLHRPSKEELLAAASGFWHRLGIRFKWFSIRSTRPFNLDEIGAFLSWIFWGHVLWVVIGTTTFVSLLVLTLNTVFAQETLAGWVGNYLTKSSGIKVVFESAIVPKWKGGVITFQNVFVSRRSGEQAKRGKAVSKGSSTTAAAAAAEAAAAEKARAAADSEDDGNYTQFDVTIESVNVTLSFTKWFNGKGLLRDVEIQGVRGVIDRTNIRSSPEHVDPKSYRHEHNPGDFEIDNFKMEDVLLTVYQPNNFRPFTVSVFNCELPRLRKQWLFYDFMSANNMSGSFDDSLFTVHPRQVHGHTGVPLQNGAAEEGGHWKKHTRLRIDGLNIDHLNRGVEGPFSWIHEGNVDIVADVMIPDDGDGIWTKVISGIHESIDRIEHTVSNVQAQAQAYRYPNDRPAQEEWTEDNSIDNSPYPPAEPDTPSPDAEAEAEAEADARYVLMDIRIQLNDVRASVPLFTKDLSYVNNALVRPIVAYINSRRAFIPVTCRVVKRQGEFDGSWTVFDSGLLGDVSRETYDAFSRDIVDAQARKRRIKKVGLWTLQVAAQALFIGLAGQFA